MHQLVLHANAPDMPEEQRRFAADVFWGHLIARQQAIVATLREMRAAEQPGLYEPLLRMHIGAAFTAAFPEGVGGDADRDSHRPGRLPALRADELDDVEEDVEEEEEEEEDDIVEADAADEMAWW